eukprot:c7998_g1_i1.p1 GENE.c7998_g1_i1~~c7998_g1_i1.p1  ORF type:complete len:619 (+),score=74.53 c7998_g1_i1:54-1910(+)
MAAVTASSPRHRLLILYGSQTGTARSVAERVCSDAAGRGYDTVVLSMEMWQTVTLVNEKLIVAVTSTHGEGEPPDNAYKFWRFVRLEARKETKLLSAANQYAVLALGSTDHNNFCAFGKALDAELAVLGAARMAPLGCADDATGLESVVEAWISALWAPLAAAAARAAAAGPPAAGPSTAAEAAPAAAAASSGGVAAPEISLPEGARLPTVPAANVTVSIEAELPSTATAIDLAVAHSVSSPKRWHEAEVAHRRVLTGAGAIKTILEVSLRAPALEAFVPGDAISVRTPNLAADVRAALDWLKMSGSETVTVRALPGCTVPEHLAPFVDRAVSACELVAWTVTLRSLPSKALLSVLGKLASNAAEATELLLMSSSKGSALYRERVLSPRCTLLPLIAQYRSVAAPPLAVLLELVQPLTPRQYSMSTAGGDPRIVFTLVASPVPGLCTTHMADASRLAITLHPTKTFALPASHAVPLILVCAGTGLAPFLSFLGARRAVLGAGGAVGPALLFSGHRSRATDAIYADEISGFVAAGALTAHHPAFSRDEPGQYAQAALAREAAAVHALLWGGGDGIVYVCGDGGLYNGVLEALAVVAGSEGKAAVEALNATGRIRRDVWL